MIARTIDGVDIHYDVAGDGPPVVLVHGVADSSSDWGEIPSRLADDHTVVSLDLRGHGRSSMAADYSPLVMIQDVVSVIEATGVDEPLLIGHALGGAIVSAGAAQLPCRGVVNIDQPLRFDAMVSMIRGAEDQLRLGDFVAGMRQVFESLDQGLTPEPLRSQLLANREAAHRDVVLGTWAMALTSTPDQLNALTGVVGPKVDVPYLAIYGTDQGEGYAEWLAERLPMLTVEWWEGAGHYLHLTDTDRFLARLGRFEAEIS